MLPSISIASSAQVITRRGGRNCAKQLDCRVRSSPLPPPVLTIRAAISDEAGLPDDLSRHAWRALARPGVGDTPAEICPPLRCKTNFWQTRGPLAYLLRQGNHQ